MLVSPIFANKNSYTKNYYTVPKLSFKGQLEDDFFQASKSGNVQGQLNSLSDIGFDIRETDIETGDNFLHAVLKSKSKQLINKALILLGQKTNNDEELAQAIINKTNSEGKKPSEYTSDVNIIAKLSKLVGTDVSKTVPEKTQTILPKPEVTPQKTSTTSTDQRVKLNELPKGVVLTIPDDEDEDEIITPVQPKNIALKKSEDDLTVNLNDVAGLTKAKKILTDKIVEPLNNGKKIKENGFLLYSATKCGKSFLLRSLAKTLDRKIINVKQLEQLTEKVLNESKNNAEKQQKAMSQILDKNIIQVADVQDLEAAVDFAKENYKNTNKQTMIFIDEIRGILPEVSAAASNFVTKAEQLIEDSASKGFILVATTRGIDEISPDSIRAGRFDRKIELKLPTRDERKELIDKYFKIVPEEKAFNILLGRTAGFSYKDIENLIELLNEAQRTDVKSVEKELKNYAKENDFGELSDTGTTANYDSDEFRRMPVATTFNEVAGMVDVKDKFKINLINRLKPEQLKKFKENGRPPLTSGFLLYGPPGTGKTFIAEAVAGETKIPIYKIDTSTMKDKYVGESEKKVRKLFKQLETKFEETSEYSILFIDEANSLLANRKKELTASSISNNNGDSSLVDLFLQYLNKAPERGIIPIVATNFKEEIDDAILDRLQTQISIQLPDDELRMAMVNKELAKLPEYTKNITEDEKKEIVVRLGGLSSRTISSILQKALDDGLMYSDGKMTLKDFTDAINNYAIEHDLPEINEISKTSGYDGKWKRKNTKFPANFNDVAGMDGIKNIFQTTLIDRLKPEAMERFKKNGIKNPIQSNFLLYGPPGTGKTFIAEALAGEMKIPLYELTSSDVKAGLYGESEKNIKSVFDQLEKKFKKTGEYSILFVDEANDLFGSVKNPVRGGDTSLTNMFLQRTNNSAERGIIVVAATNYKDQLEDAILSRLGKQIYVSPPDEVLRKALIESEIKRSKITENITKKDVVELIEELSGFSSRDITKILKETIRDHVAHSDEQVSIDEFRKAIELFKANRKPLKTNAVFLEKLAQMTIGMSDADIEDFTKLFLEFKEQKELAKPKEN